MKKMISGSVAIKHHFPHFPRILNDVDYIVDDITKFPHSNRNCEFFEMNLIPFQEFIDPHHLLTLKISHTIRSINFSKHLSDIRFLIQQGCQVNEELLNKLLEFWNQYYGLRRTVNFEQSNDEFFKDNVQRIYDHDFLHQHFKFDNVCKYQLIKEDQNQVQISQRLFDQLIPKDQLQVILEELFVIAFERYIIKGERPIRVSLNLALEDLITRLLPEWLAIFALKNIVTITDQYYVDYFKDRVSNFKTLKNEF